MGDRADGGNGVKWGRIGSDRVANMVERGNEVGQGQEWGGTGENKGVGWGNWTRA